MRIAALSLLCLTAPVRAGLEITAASPRVFVLEDLSVKGLSGLTWKSGAEWAAVSDRRRAILPLRLELDEDSGAILSVAMQPAVPLKGGGQDIEDIAWDAARRRYFYSTEQPAALWACDESGAAAVAPRLPKVFAAARRNLGMESLTLNAAGQRTWTACEDALACDGPVASAAEGALVRLQEFDAAGKARRQFAWRTERTAFRNATSGTGVAALCLLDDGTLLVMERLVTAGGLFVSIYAADFAGATQTSALPGLTGKVKPAGKRRLFQCWTGPVNYEGMALGPRLKDGRRALILVADSGESARHCFMALRLSTAAP